MSPEATDAGQATTSEPPPQEAVPPTQQQNDGLPLIPTTQVVQELCEFTRILILGKSGIGKSSLINYIFKTKDGPVASNYTAGKADIEKEFQSPDNPRLRIHDSQGYEAGETDNLSILTNFIERRSQKNVKPSDRIHVIWFCVATPRTGSRLIQTGDDAIFKLCVQLKVPIVLVFTKYDLLVTDREYVYNSEGMERSEAQEKARQDAQGQFQESCKALIERAVDHDVPWLWVSTKAPFSSTPSQLVDRTLELIHRKDAAPQVPRSFCRSLRSFFKKRPFTRRAEVMPADAMTAEAITPNEATAFQMASTQRVSIDAKLDECISLGKKKYWRNLLLGSNFKSQAVIVCLTVLHLDIVKFWNIVEDPPKYLLSMDFVSDMTQLVADVDDPPAPPADGNSNPNPPPTQSPAAKVASWASNAAPGVDILVTLPIIAVVFIATWAYGVYKTAPSLLRCLMAYIVDLVVILSLLFKESEESPISEKRVKAAIIKFGHYAKNDVHSKIRQFVADHGVFKAIVQRDVVFEKIVALILEMTDPQSDLNKAPSDPTPPTTTPPALPTHD